MPHKTFLDEKQSDEKSVAETKFSPPVRAFKKLLLLQSPGEATNYVSSIIIDVLHSVAIMLFQHL